MILIFSLQDRDTEKWTVEKNGISEERLYAIAYQLIMSRGVSSSSSTDTSRDERASASPDTNIAAGQWSTKLFNNTNTTKTSIRPPPGFPEIPQNPPLSLYTCDPEQLIPDFLRNGYDSNSHIEPMRAVPPEPPHMQHNYYNYPQFENAYL